ncbi:hypothetical protein RERY_21320 [Rhodococcus erythropolis]|nr:hypothetical protein RERY_21320 [Rhodococcus erythropolis]
MSPTLRRVRSGGVVHCQDRCSIPSRGPGTSCCTYRVHAGRLRCSVGDNDPSSPRSIVRPRAVAGPRRCRFRGTAVGVLAIESHRRGSEGTDSNRQSGLSDLHLGINGNTQGCDGHSSRVEQLCSPGARDIRRHDPIQNSALRFAEFRRFGSRTHVGRWCGIHDGDRATDRLRRVGAGGVTGARARHPLFCDSGGFGVRRPRRTHHCRLCRDRWGGLPAGIGGPLGAGQKDVQRLRSYRGNCGVEHQCGTGSERPGHHRRTYSRIQ